MPELILFKGSEVTARYQIGHQLVSIGRAKTNEITLPDASVSYHHAQIFFDQGNYYLRDLDSTNGTRINGRRVTQQRLSGGEEIEIGMVRLKFIKEAPTKVPLQKIKTKLQELKVALLNSRQKKLTSRVTELEAEITRLESGIFAEDTTRRNLKTLLEVGQQVSQVHSFPKLFETIITLAIKTLRADRGLLMTKDNEGKLTPRVNREMETEIKEIKVAEELSISQTVIKQVCQTKKPLLISSTKANPYLKNQKSILLYGIQSILVTPILAHDQTLLGVLYLDTRTKTHCFSEKDLELMTGFANQVAIALENELLKEREKEAVAKSAELAAKARYAEQIKKLEEENKLLQARLPRSQFEGIIGQHESIQRVFSAIEQAAATDVTVLITGETGTGKELVARAIHQRSKRSRGPFVVINCTTIPEQLLESELFGYEKGAFTQAYILKEGKFELAEGGTVFLDEIAELPFSVQSKLLRVIELHEIERIGGKGPIKVDIRLVAATNKNLEQLVQQGKFREDLYYRLNVVQISLPPLRERGEDIYLLANYFLTKFNSELQREIKGFSPEAWQALSSYEWPGNVRELWNRIKSAMVMTKNLYLSPEDLGFVKPSQKLPSLKEAKENLEAELVKKALFRYQGNVSRAARELKISRGRLRALITKYHIKYEPGFSEKLEK